MSKQKDLHYLLEAGTSGIKTYEGGEAIGQRIREWLAHPVGSIADKPNWGNNLESLKFEPQDVNTAVAFEMAILGKITNDVQGLKIKSISVEFVSIDEVLLTINDGNGDLSTNFTI